MHSFGFTLLLCLTYAEATLHRQLVNFNDKENLQSSCYGHREQLDSVASSFILNCILRKAYLKRYRRLPHIRKCRGGFQMDSSFIYFGNEKDSPSIFNPLRLDMIRFSMGSTHGFDKLLGHLEGISFMYMTRCLRITWTSENILGVINDGIPDPLGALRQILTTIDAAGLRLGLSTHALVLRVLAATAAAGRCGLVEPSEAMDRLRAEAEALMHGSPREAAAATDTLLSGCVAYVDAAAAAARHGNAAADQVAAAAARAKALAVAWEERCGGDGASDGRRRLLAALIAAAAEFYDEGAATAAAALLNGDVRARGWTPLQDGWRQVLHGRAHVRHDVRSRVRVRMHRRV
jgi:hypothetical protein